MGGNSPPPLLATGIGAEGVAEVTPRFCMIEVMNHGREEGLAGSGTVVWRYSLKKMG